MLQLPELDWEIESKVHHLNDKFNCFKDSRRRLGERELYIARARLTKVALNAEGQPYLTMNSKLKANIPFKLSSQFQLISSLLLKEVMI